MYKMFCVSLIKLTWHDASEIRYGLVSYLRLVNGHNEVHCFFLCAKWCVAPLKMMTILHLELSAAVTTVKQDYSRES